MKLRCGGHQFIANFNVETDQQDKILPSGSCQEKEAFIISCRHKNIRLLDQGGITHNLSMVLHTVEIRVPITNNYITDLKAHTHCGDTCTYH